MTSKLFFNWQGRTFPKRLNQSSELNPGKKSKNLTQYISIGIHKISLFNYKSSAELIQQIGREN